MGLSDPSRRAGEVVVFLWRSLAISRWMSAAQASSVYFSPQKRKYRASVVDHWGAQISDVTPGTVVLNRGVYRTSLPTIDPRLNDTSSQDYHIPEEVQ